MTTITFHRKSEQIIAFSLIGHAGFRRKGYDIVCASLSALAINTINSIDEIAKDEIHVTSNEKDGVIYCEFVNTPNHDAQVLLDAFVLGVTKIEEQYSKYCQVKIKEV